MAEWMWWQWLVLVVGVWYELCALVVSIDALGSWRDELGIWGDLLLTLVTSQLWLLVFTRWIIIYIRLVREARYGSKD